MRFLAIPGRMTIGLMIRSDARSFVLRFDAGPGGLKFQARVYLVGDTGEFIITSRNANNPSMLCQNPLLPTATRRDLVRTHELNRGKCMPVCPYVLLSFDNCMYWLSN